MCLRESLHPSRKMGSKLKSIIYGCNASRHNKTIWAVSGANTVIPGSKIRALHTQISFATGMARNCYLMCNSLRGYFFLHLGCCVVGVEEYLVNYYVNLPPTIWYLVIIC